MKKLLIFILPCLFYSFLFLANTIFSSCGGSRNNEPIKALDVYQYIELGNENNIFTIEKSIFTGHRTDSFRLELQYSNPDETQTWPSNTLLLFTGCNGQSDTIRNVGDITYSDPEARTFWSPWFPCNNVDIVIRTINDSNMSDFEGGHPRIIFSKIQVVNLSEANVDDIPVADPANDKVLRGSNQKEVLAFLTGAAERHHYYIPRPDNTFTQSIYISPLQKDLENEIGIRMFISETGFAEDYSRNAPGWIEPFGDDTGIYHEFGFPPNVDGYYITVYSVAAAPYLFSHRQLVTRFQNLVMESDANLASTALDSIAYNQSGYSFYAAVNTPDYKRQVTDYIQKNPRYLRRIREMMVFGSASLLAATEGQFRFESAHLFTSFDSFRNVDVMFTNVIDDRAPAWYDHFKIVANRQMLNYNPQRSGFYFAHEWGHYDFGILDEYVGDSFLGSDADPSLLFIDPNTIMAGDYSPKLSNDEICDNRNHRWIAGLGPGNLSGWWLLDAKYELPTTSVEGQKDNYFHATYWDVLHKLDDLFELNID